MLPITDALLLTHTLSGMNVFEVNHAKVHPLDNIYLVNKAGGKNINSARRSVPGH